ncbi:MAG: helix-turn-helix transcriptional regulator [Blautia sp.]|nr:helix-turn-helix transcriptional regulator [Blautia sp.]
MEKRVSEKMEELYSGKLMFTKKFAQRWIKEFMEEIWEISGAEAVEIPDKLREVLYYIQKNYNKKISLSEVSDQFYFNASTVSRMFVKYLGINYIEYVNTLRLEKAKEMLGNSKMNVSEVAERTGFESLSYFSKQFKKKYGVSPQDFRKNK